MSLTARLLLGYAGILHLGIGLWELLVWDEPAHKASAWQLIYRHVPLEVWAWTWILVGVLCAVAVITGRYAATAGRLAFLASAGLFGVWAWFSLASWLGELGATMVGTFQLAYLAALQVGISQEVMRQQHAAVRQQDAAVRLEAANEAALEAIAAAQRSSHGSAAEP